nr:hypothetical protein [Tanacetum cinerariifolium]
MSTSTHPIIILSDSDVEDAFSSTYTPDYTTTSPDYSPTSPGNTASDSETESDPSEDPFEDHSAPLAISPFHDNWISTPEIIIEDIQIRYRSDMKSIMDIINDQEIKHMISPTPPRDTEPPIGSPISLSQSSSVRSSSPVRMAPKRTSTSAAPAMNQATIRKIVVDSVVAALEAQAATMANTDNTNRNT